MKTSQFLLLTLLVAGSSALQAMQRVEHKPATKNWVQRHPVLTCLGALALFGTGDVAAASKPELYQEQLHEYNAALLKAEEHGTPCFEAREASLPLGWMTRNDLFAFEQHARHFGFGHVCELITVNDLRYVATTYTAADCDHAKKDVPFLPNYRKKEMRSSYLKTLEGLEKEQQSHGQDRFSVQKKRYPVVFKTFLARTNEKNLSREVIMQFLQNLYAEYPHYFEGKLRIFDIGCGDGHFSGSIVRGIGSIKPQGLRDVIYAGMDHQASFVDATNALMEQEGISKPSVIVGDFKNDLLPKSLFNSTNLILASHFAYIFSDMNLFIQKVEALLQKNGLAIFLHGGDTPIDAMLQQFTDFVRPAATAKNTPLKLQQGLAHAGLDFHSFDFNPTLYFPRISEDEWELLQSVKSHDYDADYTDWNEQLKDTKHLIEFFLQDPLEAFTEEQRMQLIQEFKEGGYPK